VKDGFELLRCPSCGLVFRARMPDPAELQQVYADEYFAATAADDGVGATGYLDYVADEELHRVNARKRVAMLRRHVAPGALLDVGCAAGFFLDEARRAGWEARGIELSTTMAAWATCELGLRVDCMPFAAAELEPAAYDAITMWDYIEHSIDPAQDIRRSRELLRPGGVIALSTGDIGSLVARVSGSRWHLLTPRHHNYFFQPRTLRHLLERADLEVVSVAHPPGWYSVRYLAHKLRTMVDRSPITRVSERLQTAQLGRIRLPINLWDIMVVVARAR
jgi:2-polyprenyl-3-methyl-5-hydroxy-6-metoxy-1,4-benzoquinol methylase